MHFGGFGLTRARNNAFRESRETVIEDGEPKKNIGSSWLYQY